MTISAGEEETFVAAGVSITPKVNSVLISEERYRSYRRAVSDLILIEGKKK